MSAVQVEPETLRTPEDAEAEWLPAWFVPRMMKGNGGLALYLDTGVSLPIERIDQVHRGSDGSVWLDVVLTLPEDAASDRSPVAASHPEATVNAAHVVAAFVTGRFDPWSAWDIGGLSVRSAIRP